MFCSHIFVAERHMDSYSVILCLPVFRKILDIQMILQLCGCLSATNICRGDPVKFGHAVKFGHYRLYLVLRSPAP